MKSSKPPAVATWLAEHLIPGDKSEALAGDLLEQFSQGRSVAWYWREVLIAIAVGLSRELHVLWVATGLTIIWSFFLVASKPIWVEVFRNHRFQVLSSRSTPLAWPLSGIVDVAILAALNTIPLLISLSGYLLASRSLGLRRLGRGFSMGLIGFAIGFIAWMILPTPAHGLTAIIAGNVVGSMPLFFSLLLSVWAVRPDHVARAAARITV